MRTIRRSWTRNPSSDTVEFLSLRRGCGYRSAVPAAQQKKQKEIKAKQTKVVIKEIRFGPQTDDHDYNFKLRHAENFIKEGAKVKAYVFFRGRSIVFKEQGEILLLRFATDLEAVAKVESMPTLEGKKMNMILAPKPKKG